MKTIAVQCSGCRQTFEKKYSQYLKSLNRGDKNHFCTTLCRSKFMSKSLTSYTCTFCQKSFLRRPKDCQRSKRLFCSRSCAAALNNKLIPKRVAAIRTCIRCQARLSDRSKLCSLCKSERVVHAGRTLASMGSKRAHSSIRQHARRTFKSAKNGCKVCGYTNHVEICHIKPVKSFSPEATLGEVNHPDNLVALCPNCHWEFDAGRLKVP